MQKIALVALVAFFAVTIPFSSGAFATERKAWTLLVFMNGHNTLDPFADQDLNEMEQVGSTRELNVVVQRGSNKGTTKRYFIQRDELPAQVTSPLVYDYGRQIDMGDWKNLVDFLRWGVANYPAEHYFVVVWNHGSGWHPGREPKRGTILSDVIISDISIDDRSGHAIGTVELGLAMKQMARMIGHKVDIYGSDACLMAMAEVAGEMSDSVRFFIGSEEIEPAGGWPYDAFLRAWTKNMNISAAEVVRVQVDTFVNAYQKYSQEVTMSALDLEKFAPFAAETAQLAQRILSLDVLGSMAVQDAATYSKAWTGDSEYLDFADFLEQLEEKDLAGLGTADLDPLRRTIDNLVLVNRSNRRDSQAHGVAIWLPIFAPIFEKHEMKYKELLFHRATNWGAVLRHILE